jgi:DNA-binding IclR family transcriptional regulator
MEHRPPSSDPSDPKPEHEQRGIQSIEVGGQLLRALAHGGRPMPLKDLAAAAGMAAAKAHPYLVSFGKIGLVEQDRASGRYGLGPLALQLGLMSLQQADPVRLATPLIEDLAQQTGHTVAMAVWGTHGPTIVRLAESPAAVHVNMRHGTVFSIIGTASGQLFAAHLPETAARPLYEAERRVAGNKRQLPGWAAFAASTLAEVRRQGLSRTDGSVVAGVSALASPVFDHRGHIVLALTTIGPSAALDTRWDGPLATMMRDAAAAVSARLGYRPEHAAPNPPDSPSRCTPPAPALAAVRIAR